MRANTLTEFWRNYDALIHNLSKAWERSFGVNDISYKCFYKSCSVTSFYPTGKIWFEFGLTLTFTGDNAEQPQNIAFPYVFPFRFCNN